jgi:hypothetical protein
MRIQRSLEAATPDDEDARPGEEATLQVARKVIWTVPAVDDLEAAVEFATPLLAVFKQPRKRASLVSSAFHSMIGTSLAFTASSRRSARAEWTPSRVQSSGSS